MPVRRHIGQGGGQSIMHPFQQGPGQGLVGRLRRLTGLGQRTRADARRRPADGVHRIAPARVPPIQQRRPHRGLLGEQAQHLLGDGVVAAGHPLQNGEVDCAGQVPSRHQPAISSPLASREFQADQAK